MSCLNFFKKTFLFLFFLTVFFIFSSKIDKVFAYCENLPTYCQCGSYTFCSVIPSWECTKVDEYGNTVTCNEGEIGCSCSKVCNGRIGSDPCLLLCDPSNGGLSCAYPLFANYLANTCKPCVSSGTPPTPTPTKTSCANTNDCGHTGSCNIRACDGDPRSSDYTWSNMGCSSDCNACWCGTLIPGVTPRPVTPTPTPGGGSGGGCSCTLPINGSCLGGGCPPGTRQQTRTCTPAGCEAESGCIVDPACNPTCSVSLSPLSLNIQTGESDLVTANPSVLYTSVSQVSFSSADTGIVQVSPTTVGSAPYTTQIHGASVGTTTITATVTTNPAVAGCTASIPISVEAGGWFQTQGGDIYTGGNLNNNIPVSASSPNLSIELDDWPGIVSHQDTNGVSLGSGFPSKDTEGHWLAQSEYQGKPYDSFQFFKKKFATQIATENYPEGSGTNTPSENQVYYAKSSRTLSGNWNIGAGRWIVLLVEGNVDINTNIIVPKNSFLAIAATGNITFDPSVTQAQGMFIADGVISTGTGANAFEGQGVFATTTFSLGRDLGGVQNETTPAETFVARPDFIMSSYQSAENNLWWFFQRWQELAP